MGKPIVINGETLNLSHVNGRRTAMDLFAGCGGMSIGLENAGFGLVYANELNADAASTYKHNFPHVPLEVKDIRRVNVRRLKNDLGEPAIDLIAAGPPCQGFSTAGRKNPTDPRNLLYREVLRFVVEFGPKIVVIENVLGILSAQKGGFVKRLKAKLMTMGYNASHRVLSAAAFGVPQTRKRVFIIGTQESNREAELFPKPAGLRVSVSQALSDLKFLGPGEYSTDYRIAPRSRYQRFARANVSKLCNHQSPNHSSRIMNLFNSIPQGENARNVPGIDATGKRVRYKLHPRRRSNTITTLPEDFVHYSQSRVPTVRELARLQSFPDRFEFFGPRTTGGLERRTKCPQYTQVGNAVPPLLAEAVFRTLHAYLDKHYPDEKQLHSSAGRTSAQIDIPAGIQEGLVMSVAHTC